MFYKYTALRQKAEHYVHKKLFFRTFVTIYSIERKRGNRRIFFMCLAVISHEKNSFTFVDQKLAEFMDRGYNKKRDETVYG